MRLTTQNESESVAFARLLAVRLQPGSVVALSGPLGAGKSVLARALLRALGVQDAALPSPTFALVQCYDGASGPIAHFDWYRLQEIEEVEMLGVREYLAAPWIALIEWPERAYPLLPPHTIHITIETSPTQPEHRFIHTEQPIDA